MCAHRLPPTEHERKLKEEEFAEERKRAARDAFRDRFKDAAQESGETDEQESCAAAPPTAVCLLQFAGFTLLYALPDVCTAQRCT
jgi:hypothetical protein